MKMSEEQQNIQEHIILEDVPVSYRMNEVERTLWKFNAEQYTDDESRYNLWHGTSGSQKENV